MPAAQPHVWMPAFAGMTGAWAPTRDTPTSNKAARFLPPQERRRRWFDRLTMSGHQHERPRDASASLGMTGHVHAPPCAPAAHARGAAARLDASLRWHDGGIGAHEGHPYIKQGCEVPASAGTTEARGCDVPASAGTTAWFDRLTMSGPIPERCLGFARHDKHSAHPTPRFTSHRPPLRGGSLRRSLDSRLRGNDGGVSPGRAW